MARTSKLTVGKIGERGSIQPHSRPCYPGQPRRSAEQSRLCGILSWLPYDRPFLTLAVGRRRRAVQKQQSNKKGSLVT